MKPFQNLKLQTKKKGFLGVLLFLKATIQVATKTKLKSQTKLFWMLWFFFGGAKTIAVFLLSFSFLDSTFFNSFFAFESFFVKESKSESAKELYKKQRKEQKIFEQGFWTNKLYAQGSETNDAFFVSQKNFQAGFNAFKEKNFYQARLLFQEILKKEPGTPLAEKAAYYAALSYYYQQDYTNALQAFADFEKDFVHSVLLARAVYWQGEAAFYAHDYALALKQHYRVLKTYPLDERAAYSLYSIGFIYQKQERYDEAISSFNNLLDKYKHSPIAPEAYLQLGIAYYNLHEYLLARQKFQAMILQYQKEDIVANARFWIGRCYFAEENFSFAEREFRSVLQQQSKEILARANYFLALSAYKQKKLSQSESYLKAIEKNYPDWTEIKGVYFRLAQLFYESQNYKQSESYLQKVLTAPLSANGQDDIIFSARLLLGDVFTAQKEYIKAIQTYKVLQQDNDTPTMYRQSSARKIADVYFLTGDFKEAQRYFSRYARQYPQAQDMPAVVYMQAEVEFAQEKFSAALKTLAKLRNDFARERWAVSADYLSGEIYFKLKDYDKALLFFRKVTRGHSEHEKYFASALSVGWCYFELKQYARAADVFREILKKKISVQKEIETKTALAACLYNLRDLQGAANIYQTLWQNYRQQQKEYLHDAFFQMAWTYYRMQNFSRAANFFEQYTKEYPQGARHPEADFFLGWSFYNMQKYIGAVSQFQKTRDNEKTSAPLKEQAAIDIGKAYLAAADYAHAITALQNYLQSYPKGKFADEAYYNLSAAYVQVKNPDQSLKVYEDMKRSFSDSPYLNEILYNIGDYYRRAGNSRQAEKIYLMAENDSASLRQLMEHRLQRARLYQASNDFLAAEKAYLSVLQRQGQEAEFYKADALFSLASLLERLDKKEQALEILNKYLQSLQRDNNNAAFVDQSNILSAKIYLAKQDYEKSLQALAAIPQSSFVLAQAKFYMAQNYRRQGDKEKAADLFRQTMDSDDKEYAGKSTLELGNLYAAENNWQAASREYARAVYLYSGLREVYEQSLYKAALSFYYLRNREQFQLYLERLANAFPESKYLQELKKLSN